MGGDNKLLWPSADSNSIHDTASVIKGLIDVDKTIEFVDPTSFGGDFLVNVFHDSIL